jgi:hypothetical protein
VKAFDVKKGNVIEHNNTVYQVRDIERSTPQGRGGNLKIRFTMYSVPGGTKYDLNVGGDDELKEVELAAAVRRTRTRTARSCSWTTRTSPRTRSMPTWSATPPAISSTTSPAATSRSSTTSRSDCSCRPA